MLIWSIALLSVVSIATISAVTYAGYQRKHVVIDPTTSGNLQIAGEGKRMTSYYLDIGTWGTIDNTGYSFWALIFVYNNGNTPTTLKYVKGTLSGSNYKYDVDRAVYDRIKFFRTASSNDSTLTNSTNYQHSYYTSSSPGMATDATAEMSFNSNYVTYQVTGWHGSWIDCEGMWR